MEKREWHEPQLKKLDVLLTECNNGSGPGNEWYWPGHGNGGNHNNGHGNGGGNGGGNGHGRPFWL